MTKFDLIEMESDQASDKVMAWALSFVGSALFFTFSMLIHQGNRFYGYSMMWMPIWIFREVWLAVKRLKRRKAKIAVLMVMLS